MRWALTGTVLQNSTDDCFAALAFLRAAPLDDPGTFKRCVSRRVDQGGDSAEAGLKLLRRALAPLTLQRSNALLRGRLPPRTTLVKTVTLAPGSPAARGYGALFHSTQVVIKALSAAGDKALLSNCACLVLSFPQRPPQLLLLLLLLRQPLRPWQRYLNHY